MKPACFRSYSSSYIDKNHNNVGIVLSKLSINLKILENKAFRIIASTHYCESAGPIYVKFKSQKIKDLHKF